MLWEGWGLLSSVQQQHIFETLFLVLLFLFFLMEWHTALLRVQEKKRNETCLLYNLSVLGCFFKCCGDQPFEPLFLSSYAKIHSSTVYSWERSTHWSLLMDNKCCMIIMLQNAYMLTLVFNVSTRPWLLQQNLFPFENININYKSMLQFCKHFFLGLTEWSMESPQQKNRTNLFFSSWW